MADEKRQRAAARGVRTRERRLELRGPSIRRGPKETDDARREKGKRTLSEAFGEIPSKADFLSKADFFDHFQETGRVERAFIVPDGFETLTDGPMDLYWYRRTTETPIEKGEVVRVVTRQGEEYRISINENAAAMKVRLKGKSYTRKCTGVLSCTVRKI